MPVGYFDWEAAYDQYHNHFPSFKKQPIIGITGNFGEKGCELGEGYFESVLKAGGTPIIIPPFENRDALANVLDHIDALILSGGGDINPLFVDEEPSPKIHSVNHKRDLCELLLTRLAFDRQIPILGICRGIQTLTVALGGTIWQDIEGVEPRLGKICVCHDQKLDRRFASHTISVSSDSTVLRSIVGQETIAVNSFHHQAVHNCGPHLRPCAFSADGLIEAVESTEFKSILGVQWHPECFIMCGNECMMGIFRWLCNEAQSFASAKQIHQNILTLDSHCDTPMFFERGVNFDRRDSEILVDLHKMNEGYLDATIMAAYLKQGPRDAASLAIAGDKADKILSQIRAMVDNHTHYVGIARTPSELYKLKNNGRRGIMLAIENGYAIGKDLSKLRYFRDRGIVYMTLCHNGDNDICDSARGEEEHGGLSEFGRKVVAQMNRLGIMVDLSHSSERSFYDSLELSTVPIICSHSSSRALCNVPRNLSDEQLKALAHKGGVAQVTLYSGFLCRERMASIEDVIHHINHMANIMGVEHVGIGTDFDGDGGVPGLASASELINLTRSLLKQRYNTRDIESIWGGNLLRVMQIAQEKATE